MDEAIALCRRYVEILGGTLEVDVRLVDPGDETGRPVRSVVSYDSSWCDGVSAQ